jgi:hypothetical protein
MKKLIPFLALIATACAPGVTPSSAFGGILTTIKNDVNAHDTLAQIEIDIAKDLGQDVSPTIDSLVEDGLTLLIDAGEIAPLVLGDAQSLKAQAHTKVLAAKAPK